MRRVVRCPQCGEQAEAGHPTCLHCGGRIASSRAERSFSVRKLVAGLLMAVGLGWALFGTVATGMTLAETPAIDTTARGAAVLMGGAFFLLPGLLLAGVGALAWK